MLRGVKQKLRSCYKENNDLVSVATQRTRQESDQEDTAVSGNEASEQQLLGRSSLAVPEFYDLARRYVSCYYLH